MRGIGIGIDREEWKRWVMRKGFQSSKSWRMMTNYYPVLVVVGVVSTLRPHGNSERLGYGRMVGLILEFLVVEKQRGGSGVAVHIVLLNCRKGG
ncbi:hypothetical protein CK203_032017 [Vitis vinifera]|uniref:Uncharacterized protein n=1 Tax=Vitis vinifera TaxID=29760 RepID=A0A438FN50_VITVI|nr:hypothetical protein CK203_032017 [Vitis vinifera]